MDYLRTYTPGKGLATIVGAGDGGLSFATLGMLSLERGETYSGDTGANELCFVVLGGRCEIAGKGFEFRDVGERKDVFSGLPHSVYLPIGTRYTVTAVEAVEIALCGSPTAKSFPPKYIGPDEVKRVTIGEKNWTREALMILDERFDAGRLFIGEALVPCGNWASWPPHRHDFDNLPVEVDMEEIYFFRFNPPQGFGFQRIYTDDRRIDEAYTITNDSAVIIPEGYHPVTAAPGSTMYYLWIMCGDNRKFLSYKDPAYAR